MYKSLYLALKYGRTFVRRHYLFQDEISFPRAELEKNRKLRGTDNSQGQIYEHIFAQNRRYCIHPSNISHCRGKIFRTVSCFLRGVFSFECSLAQLHKTTKTLSHLGLKFERRLTVVDVRFKN